MTVELRSASSLSLSELADLFNRAYEGYVIPFRLDEATLGLITTSFDIDLEASRVAFSAGEPVGLGNLGLRGEQAWIGGVGVVAPARRQGLGGSLMHALHAEAAARGVRNVWLEVIEENAAAFKLYEKLGYRIVRQVDVWSLHGAPNGSASEVPADRAHERVRTLRRAREPWQRADETVANYDDVRGLETPNGAALFRVGGVVQLLQIAGEDSEVLLRTLRAQGTVSVLNVPADDPAADALRALGGTRTVRQREMVLALGSRG